MQVHSHHIKVPDATRGEVVLLESPETSEQRTWRVLVFLDEARRYLDAHKIIPDDLQSWSRGALVEILEDLDPDDHDAFERTLVLLAHHQSRFATRVLSELLFQIPEDLRSFAEMAYAESLSWSGHQYTKDRSSILFNVEYQKD